MANFWTIIIALVTLSCKAQPLTQGELGWPNGTNSPAIPDFAPLAFATFNVIPENNGITYATNYGTCATSTNLGIYSFLTGGQPFNGKATNIGDFADFTLGFNWIYGVVDYVPNLNFTGYDQFTYIVSNNISPANLFATAINQFLVYNTNDSTTACYGLQTFNNTPVTVQLPLIFINNDTDFYVYMNGSFTNYFKHIANDFAPAWQVTGDLLTTITCSAPLFQCLATMTIPSAGNLCTSMTNTPLPTCDFNASLVPNGITNGGFSGIGTYTVYTNSNYFIITNTIPFGTPTTLAGTTTYGLTGCTNYTVSGKIVYTYSNRSAGQLETVALSGNLIDTFSPDGTSPFPYINTFNRTFHLSASGTNVVNFQTSIRNTSGAAGSLNMVVTVTNTLNP